MGRNGDPESNWGPLVNLSRNFIHLHSSICYITDPSFHYRGRSPQPPAEEDEDDFDDTLVAIDTCECALLILPSDLHHPNEPLQSSQARAVVWRQARPLLGP